MANAVKARPSFDCFLADGRPKVKFETELAADEAAESLGLKVGLKFHSYFCPTCFTYHVGRKGKSPGVKARKAEKKAIASQQKLRDLELLGPRAASAIFRENNSPEEYFAHLAEVYKKRNRPPAPSFWDRLRRCFLDLVPFGLRQKR